MNHILASSYSPFNRWIIEYFHVDKLNKAKIFLAERLQDLIELFGVRLVSDRAAYLVATVLKVGCADLRSNVTVDAGDEHSGLARVFNLYLRTL